MRFAELEFSVEYSLVRLRGAAPTPLALPCPFRTSTWTRTDAERDKREVAKIPHVEEEFREFWLHLDVCNAWMIYKIGVISKRYVIMFGILRWHVQLTIVWSQIGHQVRLIARAWMIYEIGMISKRYVIMFPRDRYLIMFGILRWHVQLFAVWLQIVNQAFNCTRLDDLQNWHHLQTVLDNVSASTTLQGGANQAVAVIRYSWCRTVGFIRPAVGCVCAVGLSCTVCVQAMWLKVWLQDDT